MWRPDRKQQNSVKQLSFNKKKRKKKKEKNLTAMQETRVRSLGGEDSPGERNGNPLEYSCLENPMDRGAWRAAVHEVTNKELTQRSS